MEVAVWRSAIFRSANEDGSVGAASTIATPLLLNDDRLREKGWLMRVSRLTRGLMLALGTAGRAPWRRYGAWGPLPGSRRWRWPIKSGITARFSLDVIGTMLAAVLGWPLSNTQTKPRHAQAPRCWYRQRGARCWFTGPTWPPPLVVGMGHGAPSRLPRSTTASAGKPTFVSRRF